MLADFTGANRDMHASRKTSYRVSIEKQSLGGLFDGVQNVQAVQNVWNDLNGRLQHSYAALANLLGGSCAAGSKALAGTGFRSQISPHKEKNFKM